MNPLVTIVIPTIGRPQYIKETIQSVLDQSYANIEIIVSENATPFSISSLFSHTEQIENNMIIATRSQRLPFAEHLNACISDATGEFVLILSDDDLISPDFVSEMMSAFSVNQSVIVALGPQIMISKDDTSNSILRLSSSTSPQIFPGSAFVKKTFANHLDPPLLTHVTFMARKRDILGCNGFGESYPYGLHSDSILFLALAFKGNIYYGSEPFFYRVYSLSHGLSAPYHSLLWATYIFSRDFMNLLFSLQSLSYPEKIQISTLSSYHYTRMLYNRIRRHTVSSKYQMFLLSWISTIAYPFWALILIAKNSFKFFN